MRITLLVALLASAWIASPAFAVAQGGLPPHVCEGPAGASNPNCDPDAPGTPNGGGPNGPILGDDVGDDDAEPSIPEPGAALAFGLGIAILAARSRTPERA
jgi:hypothetical protein